jgi:hypothetical protein
MSVVFVLVCQSFTWCIVEFLIQDLCFWKILFVKLISVEDNMRTFLDL